MKQSFIFVTISIFLFACSTKRSKVVETYTDGKKKVEFIYKSNNDVDGSKLINGQKLLYDSLGNLAQTDDYLNGRLNGEEKWYYSNGKIWMITKVRNDSAYGFEYELSEKGDTLKAQVHYGLSIGGIFYKKWLANHIHLTGSYGDSDRTYVVWKWINNDGKEIKQKVDSGTVEDNDHKKFIAPE